MPTCSLPFIFLLIYFSSSLLTSLLNIYDLCNLHSWCPGFFALPNFKGSFVINKESSSTGPQQQHWVFDETSLFKSPVLEHAKGLIPRNRNQGKEKELPPSSARTPPITNPKWTRQKAPENRCVALFTYAYKQLRAAISHPFRVVKQKHQRKRSKTMMAQKRRDNSTPRLATR
jgi:hypothetical protein